jgi:diamine N-acetyltransferase
LLETQGCRSCALSYSPQNTVARALYQSLGFVETGEIEDGELVARLSPDGC